MIRPLHHMYVVDFREADELLCSGYNVRLDLRRRAAVPQVETSTVAALAKIPVGRCS